MRDWRNLKIYKIEYYLQVLCLLKVLEKNTIPKPKAAQTKTSN